MRIIVLSLLCGLFAALPFSAQAAEKGKREISLSCNDVEYLQVAQLEPDPEDAGKQAFMLFFVQNDAAAKRVQEEVQGVFEPFILTVNGAVLMDVPAPQKGVQVPPAKYIALPQLFSAEQVVREQAQKYCVDKLRDGTKKIPSEWPPQN